MENTLTPTMEDYLETIYNLDQKMKVVRVRDIAKSMGVKLPSVTSMLNTLKQKDLINHEKYEYVELSLKGEKVAREVALHHKIIFNFLTDILQIDPQIADEDACKMEHAVSSATLKKLIEFVEFVEVCPRAGYGWLDYFNQYCKGGRSKDECVLHMEKFIKEFSSQLKK